MYYKSKATGYITTPQALQPARDFLGPEEFEICFAGVIEEMIDPPSVVDCLKYGNFATACHRYKELHKCGYAEASHVVKIMKEELIGCHVLEDPFAAKSEKTEE